MASCVQPIGCTTHCRCTLRRKCEHKCFLSAARAVHVMTVGDVQVYSGTPEIKTPEMGTPEMGTPEMRTPEIRMP